MNKTWKYLLYAGIIFLIGAVAWEAYEVASGERGDFTLAVLGMPKSTLFSAKMENHLKLGINPSDVTILENPVSFAQ